MHKLSPLIVGCCALLVSLSGQPFAQDSPASKTEPRKEVSFNRHFGFIKAVAYAPDGARIASADGERVKVTDIATGKQLFEVKNGKGMFFQSIAYSPDGKTLAAGQSLQQTKRTRKGEYTITAINYVGNVLLCDAETGAVKATLNLQERPPWALAFSPDGKWLAMATGPTPLDEKCGVSCGATGEVVLVDLKGDQPIVSLRGNAAAIQSVTFSPDGRWLAGGGSSLQSRDVTKPDDEDPLEAYVWEAATGKLAHKLTGQRTTITSLAFSPDGKWLATAARDRSLKIWNTKSWKLEQEASDYMISYDELLASAENKDVKNAKDRIPPRSWLSSIVFSADSQFVYGGGGDALLRVYSVTNAKLSRFLKPRGWPIYMPYFNAFDLSLRTQSSANMPDASTPTSRFPSPIRMPVSGSLGRDSISALNSIALSPDGKTLALGTADGKVRLLPVE